MTLYKVYDKACNHVWDSTYSSIDDAKACLFQYASDLEDSLYEIFHYEEDENGHIKCVTDWRSI